MLLLCAGACQAGENMVNRPPTLSGSYTAEARLGYWSGNRALDDRTHYAASTLGLRGKLAVGQSVTLKADGYLQVLSQDYFQNDPESGSLRELSVGWRGETLSVRAGRMQFAWGRADAFNPTDNLSARDYTLLMIDEADNRLGSTALAVEYEPGPWRLSAYWLSPSRRSVIPLSKPEGVDYRFDVDTSRSQFAFRLDGQRANVDGSISYYHGTDVLPDVDAITPTATGVDILLLQHMVSVFGGDVAIAAGNYIFRGELAYTRTESRGAQDLRIKKPFIYGVVGAEHALPGNGMVGVQLLLRHVRDYADPHRIADPAARFGALLGNQLERNQQGLMLRLSRNWLDGETLTTELVTVRTWPDDDFLFLPKFSYRPRDNIGLTLGANILRGPAMSFFGNLRDNSLLFFEVRLSR